MITELPELSGRGLQLIRVPAELDVAVSRRVLAVLDTPAMQRLKHISQLGLVGLVYPGATHHRFEHCLGVYRLACLAIRHLLNSSGEVGPNVTLSDLKVFLLAALLHDVGHWPYCHPIEDLRIEGFPRHESLARSFICSGELASVIDEQWGIAPEQVADFIADDRRGAIAPVLQDLLNGPIDIDKMDYLQRDSLHAGVPYGRNFDIGRLISSLCIGADGGSIAITEKGKTAAEMMVFARYVMFSEVYWHHTVRSATAMLQRLIYSLRNQCEMAQWLLQSDAEFAAHLLMLGADHADLQPLLQGLFGARRSPYKRLAQFTFHDSPELFAAVARRPYPQLVQIAEMLSQEMSRHLSRPLATTDILIDAPPVKLEVQFKIDVRRGSVASAQHTYLPLADLSPVVRSLATDQFDNFVKRVRVFVEPSRLPEVAALPIDLADKLLAIAKHLN